MISDCCGAPPKSNGDNDTMDSGICPACGEHCEYIDEEDCEHEYEYVDNGNWECKNCLDIATADEVIIHKNEVKIKELESCFDNKVHLCDSCTKDFPTCDGSKWIYGNGKGNDNVIACAGYVPHAVRVK